MIDENNYKETEETKSTFQDNIPIGEVHSVYKPQQDKIEKTLTHNEVEYDLSDKVIPTSHKVTEFYLTDEFGKFIKKVNCSSNDKYHIDFYKSSKNYTDIEPNESLELVSGYSPVFNSDDEIWNNDENAINEKKSNDQKQKENIEKEIKDREKRELDISNIIDSSVFILDLSINNMTENAKLKQDLKVSNDLVSNLLLENSNLKKDLSMSTDLLTNSLIESSRLKEDIQNITNLVTNMMLSK